MAARKPAPPRRRARHEPEVVMDNRVINADPKFFTLPMLNVIALVGFAVVGTMQVSGFKYDIETRLKDVEKTIVALDKTLVERTAGNIKTNDMTLWCAQAEIANPKWKCPSFINAPR